MLQCIIFRSIITLSKRDKICMAVDCLFRIVTIVKEEVKFRVVQKIMFKIIVSLKEQRVSSVLVYYFTICALCRRLQYLQAEYRVFNFVKFQIRTLSSSPIQNIPYLDYFFLQFVILFQHKEKLIRKKNVERKRDGSSRKNGSRKENGVPQSNKSFSSPENHLMSAL